MNPTIYKIEFPDGQRYIGGTVNFTRRCEQHRRAARKGTSVNHRLALAFLNHGVENAVFSKVREVASRSELPEAERLEIMALKPELNVCLKTYAQTDGSSGKPISFGPFSSLSDAAKALGFSYKYMLNVYKRKSYQDIVELKRRKELLAAARRNRKPKLTLTYNGVTKTHTQWSKELGIRDGVLYGRLKLGWSIAQALGVEPTPRQVVAKPAAKPKSWMSVGGYEGRPCDLMRGFGITAYKLQLMVRSGNAPYYSDRYLIDEFTS